MSKQTKSGCGAAGTQYHSNGYNLPPHNALAQILSDSRELPNRGKTRAAQRDQERPQDNKPNINHTYQVCHPRKRPPLCDFENDPHTTEIKDLQIKETENYRSAMSKMAEDIIALRTQVMMLEGENSQLRSDLSLHQDLGRSLLDDTNIDVMTKAEMADQIASLKFKLASETSKAASQRDRIQLLQNELIRKNDCETELLELQRLQQRKQEESLQHQQHHMAKMAAFEATVTHQGKVIEKMEKALDSKLKENLSGDKRLVGKRQSGDHRNLEIQSALAAENARLREELDRNRQQPANVITQQSAQTEESLSTKERLPLLNKQSTTEARVQTLEAQLEENSKAWGRQRQELLIKLNEYRCGFVRTSATILHTTLPRTISRQQSRQMKQKLTK